MYVPEPEDLESTTQLVVAVVEIVPLFVNVLVDDNVNTLVPIATVPPDAIVKTPVTVIAPKAVFVSDVFEHVKFTYVLLGILLPPKANSTVPPIDAELVVKELDVFSVPEFDIVPALFVKLNVDISSVPAFTERVPFTVIAPNVVFMP